MTVRIIARVTAFPSSLPGVLAGLAVCLAAAGCSSGTNLSTASGVVTLNGEPLPNAYLQFHPTSTTSGTTSYGKTDSDGEFTMRFSESQDGVIPGEYRVEIYTADSGGVGPDGMPAYTPELVPARYRTERTELTRTIEDGKHNEFIFELTSTQE